jgi:hypothetical protein
MVFSLMALLGFGVFAYWAFLSDQPRIGWISFLHNLYIFTGITAAGVLVAAILQATKAFWGRPVKRFAEATGAFFPVVLIGIVILYFGAEHLYSWLSEPIAEGTNKAWWLQKNFLFGRDFLAVVVLALVAYGFMKTSIRPDLGLASEKNSQWRQPQGWTNLEQEIEKSQDRQGRLGVLYCVLFAVVISLLSYDWLMALDYKWFSAMWGGWHFTTTMLVGWSILYYMAHFLGNRFGLSDCFPSLMYHDAGKLVFGFTVVWAYLFFAQYLVIWYGNLPHEAGFILTRMAPPWRILSQIVFLMVFLLPFFLGLGKQRKMAFFSFLPILLISNIGVWLERLLLIAPSVWYFDRSQGVFQGGLSLLLISDVFVFIGFLGLFLLVYTRYLYRQPLMVISDPKLDEGIHRH